MGKTLFHLDFYGGALVYFDKIVQAGTATRFTGRPQVARGAVARAARVRRNSGENWQYYPSELNDPALSSVQGRARVPARPPLLSGTASWIRPSRCSSRSRDSAVLHPRQVLRGRAPGSRSQGKQAIDAFKEILLIGEEQQTQYSRRGNRGVPGAAQLRWRACSTRPSSSIVDQVLREAAGELARLGGVAVRGVVGVLHEEGQLEGAR